MLLREYCSVRQSYNLLINYTLATQQDDYANREQAKTKLHISFNDSILFLKSSSTIHQPTHPLSLTTPHSLYEDLTNIMAMAQAAAGTMTIDVFDNNANKLPLLLSFCLSLTIPTSFSK